MRGGGSSLIEDGDGPSVAVTTPFRLGPYLVTPQRNRLGVGAGARTVQPKVMRLLCVLAHRPGRTFSRSELIDTVWEGTIVSNAAIDRAVCNLRKALGDSARRPVFIETIQKRGFRLMVAVEPAAAPPPRRYTARMNGTARWARLRDLAGSGRLIAATMSTGLLIALSVDAERPLVTTGAQLQVTEASSEDGRGVKGSKRPIPALWGGADAPCEEPLLVPI